MLIELGEIEAIFRYPVKSMSGERLDGAELGWHGIQGDRRLAFRRTDDRGDFPWLTAGRLPDLVRFSPLRHGPGSNEELPTHVRTPEGAELELFGQELAADVERRHGAPVQMMQLKHGIFDEASLSVISSTTVCEICRLAGQGPDVRRFRPNVVIRSLAAIPFEEDRWVGGVLSFGQRADAAAINVTMRDVRCSMVNLDPHSPASASGVLKAIVRVNQNSAGVYGTVVRGGRLAAGQKVLFAPPAGWKE
jgi:hypothetical protein